MKIKIKISKKSFVRLIMWLNRMDFSAFPETNDIDRLNMRAMYLYCFHRHEQWRNDKYYHEAKKLHTISLDVNHFGTLQKFHQHDWEGAFAGAYEFAVLSQINEQAVKQIDTQIFLNQNLVMF